MAEFTHEYSKFPSSFYTLHNFLDLKDAPITVAQTVKQIKTLIMGGNYNAAALLIEENKNQLSQYMIDAKFINALEEEIRNVEIFARTKVQGLYYQEDEPDGVYGDVWIA